MHAIGFEGESDLVDDIEGAFQNDAWVEAADGHWASSHENEILCSSWFSFVELVKHQSRFFFHDAKKGSSADPQEIAPQYFLKVVGSIVRKLGATTRDTMRQPSQRHRYGGDELDAV
ncbi:MAG: HEPN-associated N-terminal domain-containing protein [Steroidobacter sp.]